MPGFRLAWVNWLATALVLAGFVAVWVRSAPRARTGLLAAFAGALGISSGYILYVYTSHEYEKHGLEVLGLLLIVGIMSFVFEVLRHTIEEHERPWPVVRILSTVLMLAVFELYIVAWHKGLEMEPHELTHLAEMIFGSHFPRSLGTAANLTVLGILWIAVGITVAWCLRGYVLGAAEEPVGDPERGDRWPPRALVLRGALSGLVGGVALAPLMAVAYVLVVRAWLMSQQIHADPATYWRLNLQGVVDLLADFPPLGPVSRISLGAMWWLTKEMGFAGMAIGLGVVVALAVFGLRARDSRVGGLACLAVAVAFLSPMLVSLATVGSARNLGLLCLLAMFVWGVPAVLLGALAPFLRQPAWQPHVWGGIAFSAALVLAAVVVAGTWGGGLPLAVAATIAGLAAVLLVAGGVLWRGAWIVEFWPVLGLSVAVLAWAGASGVQKLDILAMQRRAYMLIEIPVSRAPDSSIRAIQGVWNRMRLSFSPDPPSHLDMTRRCAEWGPELDKRIGNVKEDLSQADRAIGLLRPGVVALRQRVEGLPAPSANLSRTVKNLENAEKRSGQVTGAKQDVDAMTKDLDALAAALDRQPPALGYYPSCLAILGDRPQALRQAVEIRARRYEQINAELPPLRVDLEAAGNRVKSLQAGSEKELEHIRVGLAQQLELAVVASFGFWTTVSMLAMWRLLDRSRTPEHGDRVDRAGAAG